MSAADPGRAEDRRLAAAWGMDPDDEAVLDSMAGTTVYQMTVLYRNGGKTLRAMWSPFAAAVTRMLDWYIERKARR